MPFASLHGIQLHYQIDRARTAPDTAPWLVLSNSLGTSLDMWAPQVPAFSARFNLLRYDTRGHGKSDAPPGPYTVEQLVHDVVGLLDHLKLPRAHFCGLSMGGLTGIALGARYPQRVARLVLSNTAARIGTPEAWQARIEQVHQQGMAALADGALERWFTDAWRRRSEDQLVPVRAAFAATDPEGYAANCAALASADLRPEAARITAPTLVISGTHDPATTPEEGRWLAGQIPGARYLELDASHLSSFEQAQRYTDAVLDFLGN